MSCTLRGKRSIVQPSISIRVPDRVVTGNLLATAIVIRFELPVLPAGSTVLGEAVILRTRVI